MRLQRTRSARVDVGDSTIAMPDRSVMGSVAGHGRRDRDQVEQRDTVSGEAYGRRVPDGQLDGRRATRERRCAIQLTDGDLGQPAEVSDAYLHPRWHPRTAHRGGA